MYFLREEIDLENQKEITSVLPFKKIDPARTYFSLIDEEYGLSFEQPVPDDVPKIQKNSRKQTIQLQDISMPVSIDIISNGIIVLNSNEEKNAILNNLDNVASSILELSSADSANKGISPTAIDTNTITVSADNDITSLQTTGVAPSQVQPINTTIADEPDPGISYSSMKIDNIEKDSSLYDLVSDDDNEFGYLSPASSLAQQHDFIEMNDNPEIHEIHEVAADNESTFLAAVDTVETVDSADNGTVTQNVSPPE